MTMSDLHRRFADELAALTIEDEGDLVRLLQLATRLSLLGDPAPLAGWTARAQGRVDALAALATRADELERELWRESGLPLGTAVCEVQDLVAAIHLDPSRLLEGLRARFERLGELADAVPLDGEAAEIVAGYAEGIPVPEEIRLATVERPLGLGALAAVAARTAVPTPIRLERRPTRAAVPDEEAIALCAGPTPVESLRVRFEGRHAAGLQLDDGTRLDGWARLRDDWSIAISLAVRAVVGAAPQAIRARIGSLRAEPDPDAPGVFTASLVGLSPDARSRLLIDEIVVTLSDGRRVAF